MINATQAQDIRQREEALKQWLGKRNSYKSEELPRDIIPPTNEERSALECFEFVRDKPDNYFCYIKHNDSAEWSNNGANSATTWTGEKLSQGAMYIGPRYRCLFGDWRRSVKFLAINGETYSGTFYCSAGDYARIKRIKSTRGRWKA